MITGQENLSKGQRTALKILEAAGRCVAKIGAEKTSITAIAKEANLKRSLIAYHFPKKDDIFYQVMVHIMVQFGRSYLSEKDMPEKGREGLKGIVEAYMDYFYEYPHYFRCYLHCYYLASVHDRYKTLNTKILKRIVSRILIWVRKTAQDQGIDASIEDCRGFSKVVYSNLLGTVMTFYTVEQDRPYDEYKANCLQILDDEIEAFLYHAKKNSITH